MPQTVDAAARGARHCELTADGMIWYRTLNSQFPPTRARVGVCRPSLDPLVAISNPAIPRWGHAPSTTHGIFVATTLQDDYSRLGTVETAAIAQEARIPLTWLLGNLRQLEANARIYDTTHKTSHADLQIEPYEDLEAAAAQRFPWYRLTATIDGGGHERDVVHDIAMHSQAFWGIAWNSSGIDGISDRGAPWGFYCADSTSYKRPDPHGNCSLIGMEWTARDLTRAYFSSHEEAYSTEPVDVLARGLLSPTLAATYERSLVDAYAAAAVAQPMVLLVQQEAAVTGADPMASYTVLHALYDEARRDHMRATTMSEAISRGRSFAARPRAIAFPYIAGLPNVYQGFPNPAPRPYPATVDYVDASVSMTFVEGETLPTRLFPFAADRTSSWDRQLRVLPNALLPRIDRSARAEGVLYLQLYSPLPIHFGLAIWSDAKSLGWSAPSVVLAGHAATIVPLDLHQGETQVALRCRVCGEPALPLSE